jgi:predicted metal-dependent phosphotriesterase family hydrolase
MEHLKVMTVAGPVAAGELGLTLHHEHVMSTFGAELARYPIYDSARLFEVVSPYLKFLRDLGVRTVVDCTAAYFGRHPEFLRKLALDSGLHILTNTGYYGAANDRYVPAHGFAETADQIAARWIREWMEGIDGTDIYPGFIKTAVDAGPLSEIDRKLIIAAARTHRQTGLTIQTHTGDNVVAANAILDMLRQEGVHPGAWIWIHAHNLLSVEAAIRAAEQGAWISFDGLNSDTATHTSELLQSMHAHGLLDHVLLSHDGDSYMNGVSRPYHFLMTDFIPLLKARGFTDLMLQQLVVDNPSRAYTVQPRLIQI